jgi:hypothetical protein
MIPFPYQTGQFGRRALPTAAADPDFANVSLLMHFDGTNGSTTFTDSSLNGFSPTVFGNAQISTAQSKFGGASGLFDGTGDYLRYSNNAAFGFGSGDYTVEGWIRQDNVDDLFCVFDNRDNVSVPNLAGIGIYTSVTGATTRNRLILANNSAIIAGTSTTQFNAATNFQHWAVARSGTTVKGFIDGVEVWSVTDSRTLAASPPVLIANGTGLGQEFTGYLDDLRVTKGVARYTAGFTPPTAPFPDS